jgi:transposase InsO family protein
MPRSEAAKPKRVAKKAAKRVKPLTMEELVKWAKTPHPRWVGDPTMSVACAGGVRRARRFKSPAAWWKVGDDGKNIDRWWVAYRLQLTSRERVAWPDVERALIAEVRR